MKADESIYDDDRSEIGSDITEKYEEQENYP